MLKVSTTNTRIKYRVFKGTASQYVPDSQHEELMAIEIEDENGGFEVAAD
jgi:hypothetical protein